LASQLDVLVVFASPPDASDIATATSLIAQDPRIATLSFGAPGAAREAGPGGYGVPFAAGAAVLVAARAAELVGALELDRDDPDPAVALVDFSLRARGRGFYDLAVSGWPEASPAQRLLRSPWLAARHPVVVPGLVADAPVRPPPRPELRDVSGDAAPLRVLIDDTTLGPYETGAQITTLALIRALAARDDIAEVGVALKFGPPDYAREVLSLPKVSTRLRLGRGYEGFAHFDVLHRTTQPDPEFSVAAARACASRVVVSLLDLIGFRSGTYFATPDEWSAYRGAIREAVAGADAVTTISADVARAVAREALPVTADRLFPVLYGTDHLTGREAAELPPGLVAPGRIADEFVLCLGTDYRHKNRDLALRIHRDLRKRGRTPTLVLAGASVPYGGSSEMERSLLGRDVVVLPSVRPEERNWLLKHAAVVLYPTSAEGFGLVPFEAARFGTPTVHARFGPFFETLPEGGVGQVDSWRVEDFTDLVEALLRSPGSRALLVARTLEASAKLPWAATVDHYVTMYRALLETDHG
jgi:glycosyltransferase involved in cell wall biosynthesis